jgi:hypothetical protein
MDSSQTVYRGYEIQIVGKDTSWSFRAHPQTPELPILPSAVYPPCASHEGALAGAKKRIDRLLTNYP